MTSQINRFVTVHYFAERLEDFSLELCLFISRLAKSFNHKGIFIASRSYIDQSNSQPPVVLFSTPQAFKILGNG